MAFTLGTVSSSTAGTPFDYTDLEWGNLLTEYNNYYRVAYDEIGNPIKKGYWMSSNEFEFGYELDWNGRQLMSAKYFDYYNNDYYLSTIEFTYNADGIRTSKTVNGVKHEYYLNGSQILAETWTENGVEHLLVFVYDETGSPVALKYRTNSYAKGVYDLFFYEKNLQGDIIGIYNATGKKIGTYNYNAWGYHFPKYTDGNTTLENRIVGSYNPFRYRGYYYDKDTGLYYLQSRYYDPNLGRFINADAVEYLGANGDMQAFNLFAYCSNDPINCFDPRGTATNSIGVSFSFGFFGSGYTFGISLATDSEGMVAFQWSYSVPKNNETRNTELGVNIGVGASIQHTELKCVDDLNGKSKAAGVAVGAVSGDIITDSQNNIVGYQAGVGAGMSYSAHVNETYTGTIGNPFKSFIKWLEDLW